MPTPPNVPHSHDPRIGETGKPPTRTVADDPTHGVEPVITQGPVERGVPHDTTMATEPRGTTSSAYLWSLLGVAILAFFLLLVVPALF